MSAIPDPDGRESYVDSVRREMQERFAHAVEPALARARVDERNKAADFLERELIRSFGRWTFGCEHDVVKRIREGRYD